MMSFRELDGGRYSPPELSSLETKTMDHTYHRVKKLTENHESVVRRSPRADSNRGTGPYVKIQKEMS